MTSWDGPVHVLHDAVSAPPAGLDALVAAVTAADGHPPYAEHTLLTLLGARAVPHARVLAGDLDDPVGLLVLTQAPAGAGRTTWYVELGVHPAARGRGVGRALLDAAFGHVAAHGGGRLRLWSHRPGPEVERLVAAYGFATSRTLLVLERPLAGELPDASAAPPGLVLRTLRTADGADRAAWLRLSNAAFLGHPENGGWTAGDLTHRMDAPWTDGRRFPVVEDGEGLLGGVWTKVVPGEDRGELYVVAVHPRAQGRGIGHLVVAAALRALAGAGLRTAFLYVDEDNVAARRLYAATGFAFAHADRCLDADVGSLRTVAQAHD